MAKRGNENAQQSKEDWESSQNGGSDAGPAAGNFEVASDAQLKKRRILKVTGRGKNWNKGGGAGTAATAPQPPSAASFGAAAAPVSVPQPPAPAAAAAAALGGSGAKNPFANISLANSASTGATAEKPKFSFGGFGAAPAAAPAAAAAAASSTFSFGAAAAPPATAAAPSTSTGNGGLFGNKTRASDAVVPGAESTAPAAKRPKPAVPATAGGIVPSDRTPLRKDFALNQLFLDQILTDALANPMSDWTFVMDKYLDKAGRIAREMDGESAAALSSDAGGAAAAVAVVPMGGVTVTSPAPAMAPKTAPAPAPAAVVAAPTVAPTSAPAPAPVPFAGFSFSTPAAAATATASAESPTVTSFSFPKPTAAPVPAPAPAPAEDGDGGTAKEDPSQVLKETNTDEDVLLEVKAKYYKMDKAKNEWKPYASGPLRLYRHKADPTRKKMVLRDSIGKVQLNLGIAKGMQFHKMVKKKKGHVRFVAIQSEELGAEQFNILVMADKVDKFYDTLVEMAK